MHKLLMTLVAFALGSYAFAQTGGDQQTATVTLSVAQLQTLREMPVVVIPDPGQGMAISPVSATLQYNFGTQHYAGGHGKFIITLGPYGTDNSIAAFDEVNTAGFVDQDSNQTVTLQADPIDPSANVTNLDLEIVNFGPPLIDGDGTVTVTVTYDLVSTQ
jgi:hypothetical protein